MDDFGLLGGFQYYDRRVEFSLLKIGVINCSYLKDFKFLLFAIDKKNNHRLLIDTDNRLGFGHSTVFTFIGRSADPNAEDKVVFRIYVYNTTLVDYLQ